MNDGAHLGVSATRALKTILGGEPSPSEDEQMSVGQFRDWLMACPGPPDWAMMEGEDAYGEGARWAGKQILLWLLEDPHRASTPSDYDYDWDGDPDHGVEGAKPEYTRAIGWHQQMLNDGYDYDSGGGLSGFQWGWAVNAARRCVELPPVANPAILNVGYDDE